MIRFIIACAFLLSATTAFAGTITITVTNDAAVVLGTRTFTVSTAHLLRIAATMKIRYGQVPSGPPNPVTGIVPMRDRTNGEAFTAWFNGFMQGTIDAVKQEEAAIAAKAAADAITPITAP